MKKNNVVNMDIDQKLVAKSKKRAVVERHLRHEHYLDAVDNLNVTHVTQNNILSRDHLVGTYHQKRVSLTVFDTKRWIQDNGVDTLAYGHKRARYSL